MATIINKTTLQIKRGVLASEYEKDTEHIVNPILPVCLSRYWKIKDNKVLEMTDEEKTSKDNQLQIIEIEKEEVVLREKIIQDTIYKLGESEAIKQGLINENA